MTTPGQVTSADIPALLKTAGDVDVCARDVEAVGRKFAEVAAPTEGGYGWRGASDAMSALRSAWGAELKITQDALDQLASGVRTVVENLREADHLAAKRTGMHGQ